MCACGWTGIVVTMHSPPQLGHLMRGKRTFKHIGQGTGRRMEEGR
jgi:hypothetical protein